MMVKTMKEKTMPKLASPPCYNIESRSTDSKSRSASIICMTKEDDRTRNVPAYPPRPSFSLFACQIGMRVHLEEQTTGKIWINTSMKQARNSPCCRCDQCRKGEEYGVSCTDYRSRTVPMSGAARLGVSSRMLAMAQSCWDDSIRTDLCQPLATVKN